MSRPSLRLFICLTALSAAGCESGAIEPFMAKKPLAKPVYVGVDADLGLFFDTLEPYGEWIDIPKLGPCWIPRRVPMGWRPYSAGRWVYSSELSWVWIGDDSWSWATDHFGRWAFLDDYRWVWVPDRVWGPAWVYWCEGGGYVGWAPLPPSKTVADAREIEPTDFSFVQAKYLIDPKLSEHLEPITRNVTLVLLAANPSQLVRGAAPLVENIEKAIGQPVPRVVLTPLSTPRRAEIGEREVGLFQPEINRRPAMPRAIPPRLRQPSELALEQQRQQLSDYHNDLFAKMNERHAREIAAVQSSTYKPDLQRQHDHEAQVLERQRVREVEALRRRQQEVRALRTRAEAEAAELKRRKAANPQFDIPPEWQLPPEMLRK